VAADDLPVERRDEEHRYALLVDGDQAANLGVEP
jgi:hypothetical protein